MKKKSYIENGSGSNSDGGQINTALGYFKKMIEEAHRQPRAFARVPVLCVFRELFLRGRQRAAKLKQSHRVIIFSPVCCGLVRNALFLLASSYKEQQREKTKGAGPEESKRINIKIGCCPDDHHLPSFFRIFAKSLWSQARRRHGGLESWRLGSHISAEINLLHIKQC